MRTSQMATEEEDYKSNESDENTLDDTEYFPFIHRAMYPAVGHVLFFYRNLDRIEIK